MKRLFSCVCTFAAAFILMSMTGVVTAYASTGSIDTSHAKDGFITVNYSSDSKLKVGIQYGENKTSYKNCPDGKTAAFSLDPGDGTYTITVCENVSGTTYQVIGKETVNVKIKNEYAPYLISTADVQFTAGDAVSKKAAEICKGATTDAEKVTAIYNYIAGHYTYDTKLAAEISSGIVSKYIPNTNAALNSSKGICYDLSSLFAAMCRSQNIPCSLTKGYVGRSYHAWNKVNVDGAWYQIDLTYAVTERVRNASNLSDCVSPLNYTQQSDSLAIAA